MVIADVIEWLTFIYVLLIKSKRSDLKSGATDKLRQNSAFCYYITHFRMKSQQKTKLKPPNKQLQHCTTLLRASHMWLSCTRLQSAVFSAIFEVNLRWPCKFCLQYDLVRVRAIFVDLVLAKFGRLHVDMNVGLLSAMWEGICGGPTNATHWTAFHVQYF